MITFVPKNMQTVPEEDIFINGECVGTVRRETEDGISVFSATLSHIVKAPGLLVVNGYGKTREQAVIDAFTSAAATSRTIMDAVVKFQEVL